MKFNGNTPCLHVIPTSLCLFQSWFLVVITHHPCHFSFTLSHDVCDLMQIKNNYNLGLVSWHQTTICLQTPFQLGSSKLTTMVSWEGSIRLASPSIIEPTFKSITYEAHSRMSCSPTFKRMDSNHNHLSRNGWIFETSHVQTLPQTWVSFSIEFNYYMLQVLSSCTCLS